MKLHPAMLLAAMAILGFVAFKFLGPRFRDAMMVGDGQVDDNPDTAFFGKTVAIKGPFDNYKRYCGVRSKDNPVVTCESSSVYDNHLFKVENIVACKRGANNLLECQFAMKNKLTDKYCADEGNQIICNRDISKPGDWEKFAFIKQPDLRAFSFPGPKSGKNRKACTDKGTGIVCNGGKDTYGVNEKFRWVLESEIDEIRNADGSVRPKPGGTTPADSTTTVTTMSTVEPNSATTPAPSAAAPPTTGDVNDDPYVSFFGKTVAITGPYSDHRTFCGVKSLSDPTIKCEDTEVYDNHLFEVEKTVDCQKLPNEGWTECQFAFKNKLTGMYCRDTGSSISCDAKEKGDHEKYALIKHAGLREFSFPGGRSGKDRRACTDKFSDIACNGEKNKYGKNERFRWKLLSEIPNVHAGDKNPSPVVEESAAKAAAGEAEATEDTETPAAAASSDGVKDNGKTVPSPAAAATTTSNAAAKTTNTTKSSTATKTAASTTTKSTTTKSLSTDEAVVNAKDVGVVEGDVPTGAIVVAAVVLLGTLYMLMQKKNSVPV